MWALAWICAVGLTAVPDVKGPDGSTPLQWAVYRNDVLEVKRLLEAGAKVGEANNYGATPMQMAAATGNAVAFPRPHAARMTTAAPLETEAAGQPHSAPV